MQNELLLIPDKPDVERDALAKIWETNGGNVQRIGKFWIKPETEGKPITLYGHDSFCLVLAQILNVNLISPKDEMIAELDRRYLKRSIEIRSLLNISSLQFPIFIKPVKPKLFPAQIFNSLEAFQNEHKDLDQSELLICSEIINIEKEARTFILNRRVKDLALYEGEGSIDDAKDFIDDFLETCQLPLPPTFVLDLGFNKTDGWFALEFNASWGAGLNFCNPQKVISCIRAATDNHHLFNRSI